MRQIPGPQSLERALHIGVAKSLERGLLLRVEAPRRVGKGLYLYSLVFASCAKRVTLKRNESKLLILTCLSRRCETEVC